MSDKSLCSLAEQANNILPDLKALLTANNSTFNESQIKLIAFYSMNRHSPTFPAITLGN